MPLPKLRDQGKVMVGIVHDDTGTTSHGSFTGTWTHHHAGCGRLRELAKILGVTEKTQILRTGGCQAGQALDQYLRIAQQFGIGLLGQGLQDIGEAKRHTAASILLPA